MLFSIISGEGSQEVRNDEEGTILEDMVENEPSECEEKMQSVGGPKFFPMGSQLGDFDSSGLDTILGR